jgi:hypothetical protein
MVFTTTLKLIQDAIFGVPLIYLDPLTIDGEPAT